MYKNLNEIEVIQIDHTSRCNLSCPQCARMANNGKNVNPKMPITDLTVDDYRIILEPFEKNTVSIFHCGNFGDVIASPTFDETYDFYFDKVKSVRISTNGSARKPEWWKELAIKGKDKNKLVFAIDGLGDTNHIYRVGSSWNKIMENALAYINAGGWAQWNFIEFEHNYHQIDEARKLASQLGFKQFAVKYTSRFADQKIKKIENKKGQEIKDRENNINQKDINEINRLYSSFDEYVQKTKITCKFQQRKHIYIDMTMKLWPCCWFGAPEFFHHTNPQTISFNHFWDLYGKDFNDIRKHGWNILQHEFYQKYLDSSWNNQDDRYKRIYTCGRTCGEKFEFSSGYGKNFNLEKLKNDR